MGGSSLFKLPHQNIQKLMMLNKFKKSLVISALKHLFYISETCIYSEVRAQKKTLSSNFQNTS